MGGMEPLLPLISPAPQASRRLVFCNYRTHRNLHESDTWVRYQDKTSSHLRPARCRISQAESQFYSTELPYLVNPGNMGHNGAQRVNTTLGLMLPSMAVSLVTRPFRLSPRLECHPYWRWSTLWQLSPLFQRHQMKSCVISGLRSLSHYSDLTISFNWIVTHLDNVHHSLI